MVEFFTKLMNLTNQSLPSCEALQEPRAKITNKKFLMKRRAKNTKRMRVKSTGSSWNVEEKETEILENTEKSSILRIKQNVNNNLEKKKLETVMRSSALHDSHDCFQNDDEVKFVSRHSPVELSVKLKEAPRKRGRPRKQVSLFTDNVDKDCAQKFPANVGRISNIRIEPDVRIFHDVQRRVVRKRIDDESSAVLDLTNCLDSPNLMKIGAFETDSDNGSIKTRDASPPSLRSFQENDDFATENEDSFEETKSLQDRIVTAKRKCSPKATTKRALTRTKLLSKLRGLKKPCNLNISNPTPSSPSRMLSIVNDSEKPVETETGKTKRPLVDGEDMPVKKLRIAHVLKPEMVQRLETAKEIFKKSTRADNLELKTSKPTVCSVLSKPAKGGVKNNKAIAKSKYLVLESPQKISGVITFGVANLPTTPDTAMQKQCQTPEDEGKVSKVEVESSNSSIRTLTRKARKISKKKFPNVLETVSAKAEIMSTSSSIPESQENIVTKWPKILQHSDTTFVAANKSSPEQSKTIAEKQLRSVSDDSINFISDFEVSDPTVDDFVRTPADQPSISLTVPFVEPDSRSEKMLNERPVTPETFSNAECFVEVAQESSTIVDESPASPDARASVYEEDNFSHCPETTSIYDKVSLLETALTTPGKNRVGQRSTALISTKSGLADEINTTVEDSTEQFEISLDETLTNKLTYHRPRLEDCASRLKSSAVSFPERSLIVYDDIVQKNPSVKFSPQFADPQFFVEGCIPEKNEIKKQPAYGTINRDLQPRQTGRNATNLYGDIPSNQLNLGCLMKNGEESGSSRIHLGVQLSRYLREQNSKASKVMRKTAAGKLEEAAGTYLSIL